MARTSTHFVHRWTRGLIVADGGWSTLLHARGLGPQGPAELANLTHPQMVLSLARDYVAAGVQVLTTHSFAANRFMFERFGATQDPNAVCEAAARIARQAVGDRPIKIGGCIGPSGRILAMREADETELTQAFASQAQALARGGVDFLVLETFSELAEMLLALRAVKEATGLPAVASFSFDSGPQRTQTVLGLEAAAAAESLTQAGADAIGMNCGGGAAHALPAVVALRANTSLPVWVKPSAGLPDLEAGRAVYHTTPDEFTAAVAPLLDAGVNVIGGCCGVGPEAIRRLAAIVARRRRG